MWVLVSAFRCFLSSYPWLPDRRGKRGQGAVSKYLAGCPWCYLTHIIYGFYWMKYWIEWIKNGKDSGVLMRTTVSTLNLCWRQKKQKRYSIISRNQGKWNPHEQNKGKQFFYSGLLWLPVLLQIQNVTDKDVVRQPNDPFSPPFFWQEPKPVEPSQQQIPSFYG